MVEAVTALLHSPTGVVPATVVPSSAASVSPGGSSSSTDITDSSSTSASPCDFFASSTVTHGRGLDNNDSDDAELLRFGLLDSAFGDADIDIASSFASITAGDAKREALLLDRGDDIDMREFELDEQTCDAPAAAGAPSRTIKPPPLAHQRAPQPRIKREPKASTTAPTPTPTSADDATLSMLELRRKRNRDSMRRARDRQRSEQEKLSVTIEQLEDRLEALMRAKENSTATTTTTAAVAVESGRSTSYSFASYSALLRQTELLRDEHDLLSEQVRRHVHFQSRTARLAAQEQRALEAERQASEAEADHAMLQPLLQWLTPLAVCDLVRAARDRVLQVVDLTHSLVDTTQSILGWQGKRAIHANWAHYLMRKSFPLESAAALAARTWNCTVNTDVADVRQVLAWAAGTKVLHRLSRDAVVIAREMAVPNLEDIDHPIRIRYILLVFRTPAPTSADDGSDDASTATSAGGYVIGTVTLNVYGASVDECLEQKVSHQHGMHALTMYAFVFSPRGEHRSDGCDVTLAGRSGDGSLMYARKVLFEVLPSILRWENTFVAPILRVAG